MAALSDFLPYVMPYVQGCPDMLAEQHIRDTCIDFCGKSLIVQRTLDPVSAIAEIADYEFEAPEGQRVHMVMQAWFEHFSLAIISADRANLQPEVFNARFTGAQTGGSLPRELIQKDDLSFTLVPPPQEKSKNAITMRAALKPRRNAQSVDDVLFEDYAAEIGYGAIARLMRIPKQSFSDMNAAAVYEAMYVSARNGAQIRANNAYGRVSQQVQFRGI